jgi:hypothetical protein
LRHARWWAVPAVDILSGVMRPGYSPVDREDRKQDACFNLTPPVAEQ